MHTGGAGLSEHEPRSESCHADRSKEPRRPPLLPTPHPAVRFRCRRSLWPRQRHSCQLRFNEGSNGNEGSRESCGSFEPWYHEDAEGQWQGRVCFPSWRNEGCSEEPCQGVNNFSPCCDEDSFEQPCQGVGCSPPWFNPSTPNNRGHRRGRGFFCAWETTECRQEPSECYGRTRPRYNRPMGWRPRRGRGSFRPCLSEGPGYDHRRREADGNFPPYWHEPALHRHWSCSRKVGQRRKICTSANEKRAKKQRFAEAEKPTEQQLQLCAHGVTAANCQACENPARQPSATAREHENASVKSDAKDSACARKACESASNKAVPRPNTALPGTTARLFRRAEQVHLERRDDLPACTLSAESRLGECESRVLKEQRQDIYRSSTADLTLARPSKNVQSETLDSLMADTKLGKSLRMSVVPAGRQNTMGIQGNGLASQARDIGGEDGGIIPALLEGSPPNGAVVAGDAPSLSCVALEWPSVMSVTAINDSSEAADGAEKRLHSAGSSPRPAVVAGDPPSLSCTALEQHCPLSILVDDGPSLATGVAASKVSVIDEAQVNIPGSPPRPAVVAGELPLWSRALLDEAVPMCVEVEVYSSEPTDATYRKVCGKDEEPVHSACSSPRPRVVDGDQSLLGGPLEQPAYDSSEATQVIDWMPDLDSSPVEQPADDSSEATEAIDWMPDLDSSEGTIVTDRVSDQYQEHQDVLMTESLNGAQSDYSTDVSASHPEFPAKVLLKTQLNKISHVFETESCNDITSAGGAVSGAYLPGPKVDSLATTRIDMETDPCFGGGTEEKEGCFWLESHLEKLNEGWLWSF